MGYTSVVLFSLQLKSYPCKYPLLLLLDYADWDVHLAGKEEEEEVEVEEVTGDVASPAPGPAKKSQQDRGVVNGTATVAMDDVRTMFTTQPEVIPHYYSTFYWLLWNEI